MSPDDLNDTAAHWGFLDGQAVATAVKDQIYALGITQADLAKAIGVSRPALTMMLRDGPSSFRTAHRMLAAVGLSMALSFQKTTNGPMVKRNAQPQAGSECCVGYGKNRIHGPGCKCDSHPECDCCGVVPCNPNDAAAMCKTQPQAVKEQP